MYNYSSRMRDFNGVCIFYRYVPTQQDILYCRKTTKGIIEFPIEIEGVPFLFVDVGGQRTQRQKWYA